MSASALFNHSGTDQHRARNLLHALSWRAEKLFRQRKSFPAYIWITETAHGDRQWSETAASPPDEVTDNEVLATLRAEQREDFARDGVVAYAVAFPAYSTTVLRAEEASEKLRQQVICLEVHDSDVHLRAHRELHNGRLDALVGIEEASGCFANLC